MRATQEPAGRVKGVLPMSIVHVNPSSPGQPIKERRFGFLPVAHSWRVGDFIIEPVADHGANVAWARERGHNRPGHSPPFAVFSGLDMSRMGVTMIGDAMFRLPPTHIIRRSDGRELGNSEEFCHGVGAVLIESLGFLLSCRCQFDEWWFEGEVPLQAVELFRRDDIERAATEIVRAYEANPAILDKRLPRLLFMKNRFDCYGLVWEQFLVEYTVFEALWKIGGLLDTLQRAKKPNGQLVYVKHHERFEHLGGKGLIHWTDPEPSLAAQYVRARNDLVHEALFDEAGSDLMFPRHLARLTARLLFTALGIRCKFARSEWYGFSREIFGLGQ